MVSFSHDSLHKQVLTKHQLLSYITLLVGISLAYSAPTAPSPSANVTISLPQGTTNHGNPQILCTRSKWTDVATFFLANFLAHAATVKSQPGESALGGAWAMLSALVFPTSGVVRGLDAIFRHAITGSSPLQKAKKAGALCEVVRGQDWEPRPNDFVRGAEFNDHWRRENLAIKFIMSRKPETLGTADFPEKTPSLGAGEDNTSQSRARDPSDVSLRTTESVHEGRSASVVSIPTLSPKCVIKKWSERKIFERSYGMLDFNGRKIHGLCCLPPGFELSMVQTQSTVVELNENINDDKESRLETTSSTSSTVSSSIPSDICSSYSFAKGIIAIFQTLYASATLYKTTGDQIERYGYAAFGLTVAPYLVMSIINLTGTVLTPDYPTLYMVESEVMEEARRRNGACIEGAVGRLKAQKPVPQSFDAAFEISDQNRIITPKSQPVFSTDVEGAFESPRRAPTVSEASEAFMHQNVSADESLTIHVPSCHEAPGDVFDEDEDFPPGSNRLYFLSLFVGLIAVAINGGLSHFKAGKSTRAQRSWTMTWLAFGILFGAFEAVRSDSEVDSYSSLRILLLHCAPAIGGLVVVGQMLMDYGHCIQIDGGSL